MTKGGAVATDTYERQRAVRERIEQVKNFARAVDEAAIAALDAAGVKFEDLDPVGSLRAALPAVAGAARNHADFDVVIAGVGSRIGLRVRHADGGVDVAVTPVITAKPSDLQADDAPAPPVVEGLAEPPAPHVAADLASVLWQGVAPGD
jgi:hypothetical protein